MAEDGGDASSSRADGMFLGCRAAVHGLIQTVAEEGEFIAAVSGRSVGSGRPTRELLNSVIHVDEIRQREPAPDHPAFVLVVAVARLIWMLSASNRLADMAFYDQGVSRFTDNGLTVPGSSFGARLFDAQPGMDQVRAVVERLREDPNSRRAMASVYTPADSVRESGDIPCLALMAFHVRRGALHTTVVMRSNNVYRLLPYNLFEQTFLSEMIACEIGVSLGPLTYHCVSAHIYDDEYQKALTVSREDKRGGTTLWDPMPGEMQPFKQAQLVCAFEARLRMQVFDDTSLKEFISDCSVHLHEYWRDLLAVLAVYVVQKRSIAGGTKILTGAGWTSNPKARKRAVL